MPRRRAVAVVVASGVLVLAVGLALRGGGPAGPDASSAPQAGQPAPRSPPAAVDDPEAEGLRYTVIAEQTEVRYRVREQLAGVAFTSDAVGSSRAVEGIVVFADAGRVVPGRSAIRVRLASLASDQPRRDNYLRQFTLETARYPEAVFVPTEVTGLPFPIPEAGTAAIRIAGDLTIRDVTRRVEWAATARFEPAAMVVEARLAFTFEDFGITKPRVAIVLSVDDEIRLEADLVFGREP